VGVATDRTTVLGVVEAADPPGQRRDLPEINMLYVRPEAWGSSAARRPMALGIAWMAQRGFSQARLRVVEHQARARRFYEREGWALDARMPPDHNGLFALIYYRRTLPNR
jgi:GNAT superfamily N-acetyltransferase